MLKIYYLDVYRYLDHLKFDIWPMSFGNKNNI